MTVARSRRLSRQLRRNQLLDAASDLVVDGGLGAVTMEKVAEQAGVSKALPYSYFENASELLIGLYERESAALDARVAERVDGAGTITEIVRGTIEAWLDVVDQRGMIVGALLVEQTSGPLEMHRRQRLVDVQSFFAHLVSQQRGIPLERASVAAGIFIAGSLGVLDMWMNGADRSTLVDTYVEIVEAALSRMAGDQEHVGG